MRGALPFIPHSAFRIHPKSFSGGGLDKACMIGASFERAGVTNLNPRASPPCGAPHTIKETMMKKLLAGAFAALLSLSVAAAQSMNPPAASQNDNANASAAKKRGPVFRATKDQIKQAQTLLKGRGL